MLQHRVFVYGTLKEGFPNFSVNKGERVAGDFVTQERFPLYLVGARYVPWLILDAGNGHRVHGEVYMLDDEGLAAMDALEQIAEPDGYRRVSINVETPAGDAVLEAFIYGKGKEQLSGVEVQEELTAVYTPAHGRLYQRRT